MTASVLRKELLEFHYINPQGENRVFNLQRLNNIANLSYEDRKTLLFSFIRLNDTDYLQQLKKQNKEQVQYILECYTNWAELTDKHIFLLFKTIEYHKINSPKFNKWIFDRTLDTNLFNFELQLGKPFYFHLMDQVMESLNKLENNSTSEQDKKNAKFQIELITEFFSYHKINKSIHYDKRRPIEYLLKDMSPRKENLVSFLVVSYYKRNPEALVFNNERGMGFSKYISSEALLSEVLQIKKTYSLKRQYSVDLFKKITDSISVILQKLHWGTKPLQSSPTTDINTSEGEEKMPELNALETEPSLVNSAKNKSNSFAQTFFDLKLNCVQLTEKMERTNSQELSIDNKAISARLDKLIESYFLLHIQFEKKKENSDFYQPETSHFISQQFPKFLNGSLSSYQESLEFLTGEDKKAAFDMFTTNLGLIQKHLENHQALLNAQVEHKVMEKIKVEHKYLTNTMRA